MQSRFKDTLQNVYDWTCWMACRISQAGVHLEGAGVIVGDVGTCMSQEIGSRESNATDWMPMHARRHVMNIPQHCTVGTVCDLAYQQLGRLAGCRWAVLWTLMGPLSWPQELHGNPK